jgi:predicted tellurium resistance membrane protein TerC
MIENSRYLKVSLAVILILVGAKMMTHTQLKAILGEHFNLYLPGVVRFIFAAGVIASPVAARREKAVR